LKIASSLGLQLIGRDRLIWTVYRFLGVNRGLSNELEKAII
jgi:hypothetical protein